MPRMRWSSIAALACLAALAPAARAAQVVSLGSFLPSGLNSKGLVVGDVMSFADDGDGSSHAAFWRGGVVTVLPLPALSSRRSAARPRKC